MDDTWDEILYHIETKYGIHLREKLEEMITDGKIEEVNNIIAFLL